MTDAKADAQTDGPGSSSNFGVLQERVRNIDARMGELAESLKETNNAIREATQAMSLLGKPQYGLWVSTLTLVGFISAGLWGLAISPIDKDIGRLYVLIDKASVSRDNMEKLLGVELKSKLDRAEVDDIRSDMKRKIDSLNDRIDEFNMRKKLSTPLR